MLIIKFESYMFETLINSTEFNNMTIGNLLKYHK